MLSSDIKSIYIKGYKNFQNNWVGLSKINHLNIVIGRNNTGKSSFLDVLHYLCDPSDFTKNFNSSFEKIVLGYELTEENIISTFDKYSRGGEVKGNHFDFGSNYIGKIFHVGLTPTKSGRHFFEANLSDYKNDEYDLEFKKSWNTLASKLSNQLVSYHFLRLGSERDILPEQEQELLTLKSNGIGATNLIHKFINLSTLDSRLVEKDLLFYLNKIMEPDAIFEDIVVQQIKKDEVLMWEIFLEEKSKGRISLSNSGSGLKTIILVLINIILMPKVLKRKEHDIIYVLEELENSLHPSLQRNLFKFIREWAEEKGSVIFLTTHSNIPINMFSTDSETQIIHLYKEGIDVQSRTLGNYLDNVNLLDDLGVRASDILQANGVIWVEGPSDRIYLNSWINLYSKGRLIEGVDYQIIFYGGRLLSHFHLSSEHKNESSLINLLLTNRNSAILIDSDKRSSNTPINSTKKRIKKEFEDANLFCWITKGREIENYIPKEALEKKYEKSNLDFGQYDSISDTLNMIKEKEGSRFLNGKVEFSKNICKYFSNENLEETLDLRKQVLSLIAEINKWNSKD
ncbi:ATP-dependent nuclease [Exiguobacterium aurantiacum]|uniref:ATP-dependent nuclease n=1 Tax=Exiguobacterium aurantiacum TaxID=33987 RepID=UPI00384AB07F